MNNKRKSIVMIMIMLLLVVGVSYAFYTYSRSGMNQKLITGEVYMRYRESSNNLNLENAMPTNNYIDGKYFEFDIIGKNTHGTKNIFYEVVLGYGDEHETRHTRIRDDLLRFRLVKVEDNNEVEIFTNQGYDSINNQRIFVDRILAGTNVEVCHTYRLYAWIDKDTEIGTNDTADYSIEEWNDVYASIRINVNGDFEEKGEGINDYTIVFNTHGGEYIKTITRKEGEQLGILPETSKEGYQFAGWWTKEKGGTKVSVNDIVNNNIELHAHFENVVCKKAVANTLHTEICERTSEGCYSAGIGTGETITYGIIPVNDEPSPGYAYDCDVNNDANFDYEHERFYYLRTKDDNMVLIHYTNFDETGQTEGTGENQIYKYDIAKKYLPSNKSDAVNNTWTNPNLVSMNGNISRFISLDDIESACGSPLQMNTDDYTNSCYFILEKTRFKDNSLSNGRSCIWVEESDSKRFRIDSRIGEVTDLGERGNISQNGVRPVIEVSKYRVEGYREKNAYTISFNSVEGEYVHDEYRYEDVKIGNLPTTTKEGYIFNGWYKDSNYEYPVNPNEYLSSDVTFYAKWITEETLVTYTLNSHNGETVNSITKKAGDQIGVLPTLSKTGYNFAGWWTDETGGRKIEITEPMNQDTEIHARFEKIVCKVAASGSLHEEVCNRTSQGCYAAGIGNGNIISYGQIAESGTRNSGDAYDCDVNNDSDFNYEHERFYYLRTKDNGNLVFIHYTNYDEFGQTNGLSSDAIYKYADAPNYLPTNDSSAINNTWTNPGLLTINGKKSRLISIDDIETACGAPIEINKDNYLNNCYYLLEKSRFQDNNLGRSCIWIEDYNSERFRIDTRPNRVSKLSASDYNSSNNGVRPVIEITEYNMYGYHEKNAYSIKFNTNGGNTLSDVYRYEDEVIGTLPRPNKENYVFDKWYVDAGLTTPVDTTVYLTSNVTYYARWINVSDIAEVSFDAHGGTSTEDIRQVEKGTKIGDLPTSNKGNLGFNGWWTAETGGRPIDKNEIITGNITFHAQYVTSWTVTYEIDGGTADFVSKNVDPGTAVGAFPTVTKDDYLFDGWYQDPTFNIPADENLLITKNVTLYLKWVVNDKTAYIGNEYFDTLQDAVDEAANRGVKTDIGIRQDVNSENIIIPVGCEIEFDFGNHTVSNTSGIVINNSGVITIKNGNIERTGTTDQKVVINNNAGGTINITGGNIYSNVTQALTNYGTLNITGGEISVGTDVDIGVINNYNVLNISSGRIIATKRQAIYNAGGTVTISGNAYLENGVNATASRACVHNNSGTTYITGGTIKSSSTVRGAVYNEDIMTIGLDDGIINTNVPNIQGIKNGLEIKSGKTVNYYDGIIKAKANNKAINNEDPSVLIIKSGITLQKTTEMIGTDAYNVVYLSN